MSRPQLIAQTTRMAVPTGVRLPAPKTITNATTMKVGQTQIKQIINNNNASTIVNSSIITSTPTPLPSTGKTITSKSQITAQTGHKLSAVKDKEKKAALSSSYYQSAVMSMSSSVYGDDDINDVAAMGGVNLAEESQRIMGSTELIGTQIRSCKDEVFLHLPALQNKIRQIVAKHGLEEPSNEVSVLISHATQERLKNIVEKLAVVAEHRIDVIKASFNNTILYKDFFCFFNDLITNLDLTLKVLIFYLIFVKG